MEGAEVRTREEWHEYWKRYYRENIEYFRLYRKVYRKQINAGRRLRYKNDPAFRQHELDRKRDYLKRKKESK